MLCSFCSSFIVVFFFPQYLRYCIEVFDSTDRRDIQVRAKEMIETVKNYREHRREKSNNAKANAIIIHKYIYMRCTFVLVAVLFSSSRVSFRRFKMFIFSLWFLLFIFFSFLFFSVVISASFCCVVMHSITLSFSLSLYLSVFFSVFLARSLVLAHPHYCAQFRNLNTKQNRKPEPTKKKNYNNCCSCTHKSSHRRLQIILLIFLK